MADQGRSLAISVFSVATVAMIGLGCGNTPEQLIDPPKTEDAIATSGSRLRARFVVAEGGARRFVDFLDLQTSQGCTFRRAERDSDTLYCTPKAWGEQVFLDENCTTAAVKTVFEEHTLIYPAPSFHGVPTDVGAIRRGAKIPGSSTTYLQSGGRCFEVGSSDALYEISETLNVQEFVSAKFEQVEVSPGLMQARLTAEDGSKVPGVLTDDRTMLNCKPEDTSVGVRCASPFEEIQDSGLTQETCEGFMLFDYSAPRLALVSGSAYERNGIYILNAVEDQFNSPMRKAMRLSSDNTCTPEELRNGRMTLYQGTLYPETDWPKLALQTVGEGRLETNYATTPNGQRLGYADFDSSPRFKDAQSQEDCWVGAVRGELHCARNAATSAFRSTIFEDSRCSVERDTIITWGSNEETSVSVFTGVTSAEQGGLPRYELVQLGAQWPQPHIRSQEGECLPLSESQRAYQPEAPSSDEELLTSTVRLEVD